MRRKLYSGSKEGRKRKKNQGIGARQFKQSFRVIQSDELKGETEVGRKGRVSSQGERIKEF